MRHVELVAFENDSILHQKALSLPVGKVSLRQLGILVVGILAVFSTYAITDNIIVPAILFAVFLGIGLPNTKIMTPDQMIKSVILFLIRGTSLSKKPEYMQKDGKLKSNSKEQKDNQNNYIQSSEIQSNNNTIMSKIISQLESLYKKKESTESKQDKNIVTTNKDKNYSVKVELTPENMLNITPIKTIRNKNHESNSIDKLLSSLTTSKNNLHDQKDSDFLQEHMSILLDNNKIESDKIISKNDSASVLLDKNSKYDIEIIVDK